MEWAQVVKGMGVFATGGSFANVGFTTGLILPYLDIVFVGLHIILRVRVNYYACGRFITRADSLLHLRLHSADAPLYLYDLMLRKKIVLVF